MPDYQGAYGDGALHQHNGNQRNKEEFKYGLTFLFPHLPYLYLFTAPLSASQKEAYHSSNASLVT